jgi:hypothetical protein
MMSQNKRQRIYDTILESGREPKGNLKDYNTFSSKFFFFPAGDKLRLNYEGLEFMKKIFKPFEVEVIDQKSKRQIPSKHYVYLAKFCRKPYYIGNHRIVFFDDEEAFLFKMCDGDVDVVQEISPERLND